MAPERDTPGISARHWITPITIESISVIRVSGRDLLLSRSAATITNDQAISDPATHHRLRSGPEMMSFARNPTTQIGSEPTITAGLFRGLDRVAATRMAFLLGIPALVGAAVFELKDALSGDIGIAPVLVGTIVSFIVGYASVAWLIRFVAKHSTEVFAFYRVLLGIVILILLATSTITAT